MGLKDFFSKDYETSDTSSYQTLKTHYYRSKYEDSKNALINIINDKKGIILDDNIDFQELLFETKDYSCIVKFTTITPYEIAVDFKITTFNFLGLGKGKKEIEDLYRLLDNKLQFKGVSLYKG